MTWIVLFATFGAPAALFHLMEKRQRRLQLSIYLAAAQFTLGVVMTLSASIYGESAFNCITAKLGLYVIQALLFIDMASILSLLKRKYKDEPRRQFMIFMLYVPARFWSHAYVGAILFQINQTLCSL